MARSLTIHQQYRPDTAFYDEVRAAKPRYQLIDRFVIPPNDGRAFIAKAGQTFKVIEVNGPQTVDVAFWNAHNPKEAFNAERTFALEGWWIKRYGRLWSNVPWLRPMATCIDDTVVTKEPKIGFHHQIVIMSHCSPEHHELRSGKRGANIARSSCHVNFLKAIEPFGLQEEHIVDNVNLHTKARINPRDGRPQFATSDGKAGDYIEFYAEIDLLVGVSVCPGGDGSVGGIHPEQIVVRPIGIELYETGIHPQEFPVWTDWRADLKRQRITPHE
jgi:hypothetical protein